MTYIIGLLIGVIITSIVLCVIFIPKIKQTAVLDEQIKLQNQQVQKEIDTNKQIIAGLTFEQQDLEQKKAQTNQEIQQLMENLIQQQDKAKEQAHSYYESYMDQAKTQIELAEKELQEKFEQAKNDFQDEYAETMQQAAAELTEKIEQYKQLEFMNQQAVQDTNVLLEEKKKEYNTFIEILKKTQEEKEKQNFYQLQITQEDIAEIEIIRSIIPKIRNADPINKIVYKTYYEKAYTDLVGRVIGSDKTCGVYKITNLENGMCYVGQSVDIAERWRQHIKCGCGIDAPKNKLYQAMYNQGVENFSFEILEKCDKILLNDKEKLWIDNLGTNSYGYNMTAGGSKQ